MSGGGDRLNPRGDLALSDCGYPAPAESDELVLGRRIPGDYLPDSAYAGAASTRSSQRDAMRIAYADPPYLGCCGLYGHHHPDGHCWDDIETHMLLIQQLTANFDGFVLHASSPSLGQLLWFFEPGDVRVMAWVKPFAAFKANIPVAYAWEPVLVKACRKPVVVDWMTTRDFVLEPITLERGTVGAKPEAVCMWAFTVAGALPDDELIDLFPGSGAVGRAWNKYSMQFDFGIDSTSPRAAF